MCCASLLETVRENSATLCRHLADWRFRPRVEGCGALIACCRCINGLADFLRLCLPAASEDVLTGGIKLVAPTKSTELSANLPLARYGRVARDTSAVGNGKQRKARSADREPHDYCGRPVL